MEPAADLQMEQPEELQGELGAAVSALVAIVGDDRHTVRQRLKASATILGYKTQDPGVTEFVRRFLERLCASGNISPDYRIWGSELLRRFEGDAKLLPQIERPNPAPTPPVDPVAEEEARRIEFERKREHCDRLAAEIIRELGLPRQRSA
jgi:hypothetical protein